MGRKIPGRKHRTVKDPYVQRAEKFAKVKDKINNPPSKADEQEIPKSLLKIMELKQKAKESIQRKRLKKKKKNKELFNMKKALGKEKRIPGMEKPEKFIPIIQQRPDETEMSYERRIRHMCNDVIKEVEFEKKYHVEIKRDDVGRITEIKNIKREKRSKKPKLSAKRKTKEKEKKESTEVPKDFSKPELIQFGDIVHAPLTNLKTPGRKKEGLDVKSQKPGKRDLLLKKVFTDSDVTTSNTKKKVSALEKQKIEERRKAVVEAFRQSKKGRKL